MSFCGHRLLLNTKALEVAGVNKDTDDLNGLIVKDANGNPTGYIKEPVAYLPIIARIADYEFTKAEHHKFIKQAFDEYNKLGYTLLCDCHQVDAPYAALYEMANNGEFTVRVSGVHNVNDDTRDADLETAIANRNKFNVDGLLHVDTLKYFADGDLSMIESYIDTAGDKAGTRDPLL